MILWRLKPRERALVRRPRLRHLRQCNKFSLLHALNYLFQGEANFTRSELDGIARRLWEEEQQGSVGFCSCLFNPHYNVITGDYDENVLRRALCRKEAYMIECADQNGAKDYLHDHKLVGIILRHPVLGGWHWSALKKIDGVWYDLDSDFARPEHVTKSETVVLQILAQCIQDHISVTLVLRSGSGRMVM